MQITDNQDVRLALLFPGYWALCKAKYGHGDSDDVLTELAVKALAREDEKLNGARAAGWLGYSRSRHLAVKALIKELETGEPARDPMVEAATNALKS